MADDGCDFHPILARCQPKDTQVTCDSIEMPWDCDAFPACVYDVAALACKDAEGTPSICGPGTVLVNGQCQVAPTVPGSSGLSGVRPLIDAVAGHLMLTTNQVVNE